jgi:glucose-1-phosphate thymidylyltransferase
MLASDNLFDMDLSDFVAFAEARSGVSTGLFDIKDKSLAAGKYGVMELGANGEVTGMEEKPAQPKTSLVGTGVYYFSASVVPLVDEYLSSSEAKDAPGHFVRWLGSKIKIFGFILKGMWYDIGDLKSLQEADQIFSSKK